MATRRLAKNVTELKKFPDIFRQGEKKKEGRNFYFYFKLMRVGVGSRETNVDTTLTHKEINH